MIKKAIIIVLLFAILSISNLAAQTITGTIVDNKNQAIPYVNVVLEQVQDSTFISGTICTLDGSFTINTQEGKFLLKISSIGYKTKFIPCTSPSIIGTLVLNEETVTLGEVVIKGNRPQYKMTTGGIQTQIAGTVLSKLGSAEYVLENIPGLFKKGDGTYQVFGKGSPIIYINGRKVRDDSELSQLKSSDIKSVELLTNPGARYDASVRSVLLIRTCKIKGEGLGVDLRSSYHQSENIDLVEELNWNYRHNQLDLFGTANYSDVTSEEKSKAILNIQSNSIWKQYNVFNGNYYNKKLKLIVGMNYAITSDQFLGWRYQTSASIKDSDISDGYTDVSVNDEYYDHLTDRQSGIIHHNMPHQLNVYYNGKIGETTVDFNADYLFNKRYNAQDNKELSADKTDELVSSNNVVRNQIWAAKFTVSHPLFGGDISLGTDYSRTHRDDNYMSTGNGDYTSYMTIKEQQISPYIEYSRSTPIGQVCAGLRYEWVKYDYSSQGVHMDGQSKDFSSFFPNLSIASRIGQVQTQLSYSVNISRPSYSQLSSNVIYINSFTYQTGDPYLQPATEHILSFRAMWKFVSLVVNYGEQDDFILSWGDIGDNGTHPLIYFKPMNISSLKTLVPMLIVSPKIGLWSPQLVGGLSKHWADIYTDEGVIHPKRPVYFAQMNNVLNFSPSLFGTIHMNYLSTGQGTNITGLKSTLDTGFSLTKTFFNDAFSVKVGMNDLFKKTGTNYEVFYNKSSIIQEKTTDSREFIVTLRYKFNTTHSKYKGTNAGAKEINRM